MTTPMHITFLNHVLNADGHRVGLLLCGPNRDNTYTVRLDAGDTLGVVNVSADTVAIQLTQGGPYVKGDSVRSSVFADETRPCS